MKKKILFLFLLIGINCFSQEEEQEEFTVQKENVSKKEEKTNDEIYTYVEEPASFPGGTTSLSKFISDNIIIPQSAIKNKTGGKCYIKFVINNKGEILNSKVMKGVPNCPDCDKAAIDVIKKMPNWIPAKNKGELVNSYFIIPINFDIK